MQQTKSQPKNWQRVKLDDLFKIKHGYAFKGEFFSDIGEYIVLTPGNFTERDGLVLRGSKEKYYIGNFPKEYILNKDDLLIVMTDLKQTAPYLGAPGIVPEDNKFLHNQRLGLIQNVNTQLVYKDFLYWLFEGEEYRNQVRGSATGATVKHTAPSRVYEIEIFIPSLSDQKRTADILWAYDNLIENNTKRIKILEEMAQAIYKELFVYFRFPGHEKVRMVDLPAEASAQAGSKTEFGLPARGTQAGKIPTGWEVKKLGDKINILRGKNITKSTVVNGKVPVVAGGLSPAYFHNKANAEGPVITVSASGANSGYVNLYHENIWASDCSYINKSSTPFVYYYFLLLKSRQTEVTGLQRGSAQSHVYPKDLARLSIIDVPEELIRAFEEKAKSLFGTINNFQLQNQKLRQARDLLLPKLVNGEIRV